MRRRANALANWSTPQSSPGTAGKKKGGSPVRGTQESDRIASLAPAQTEVRAEQFFLAAVAQNIKRLVRFLSQPTTLLWKLPLS